MAEARRHRTYRDFLNAASVRDGLRAEALRAACWDLPAMLSAYATVARYPHAMRHVCLEHAQARVDDAVGDITRVLRVSARPVVTDTAHGTSGLANETERAAMEDVVRGMPDIVAMRDRLPRCAA
jgi:hypothetical protein